MPMESQPVCPKHSSCPWTGQNYLYLNCQWPQVQLRGQGFWCKRSWTEGRADVHRRRFCRLRYTTLTAASQWLHQVEDTSQPQIQAYCCFICFSTSKPAKFASWPLYLDTVESMIQLKRKRPLGSLTCSTSAQALPTAPLQQGRHPRAVRSSATESTQPASALPVRGMTWPHG